MLADTQLMILQKTVGIALLQRTLKKLRTLKNFQSALNLGPNKRTLNFFFKGR